jgi:hypothetical protein
MKVCEVSKQMKWRYQCPNMIKILTKQMHGVNFNPEYEKIIYLFEEGICKSGIAIASLNFKLTHVVCTVITVYMIPILEYIKVEGPKRFVIFEIMEIT